MSADPPLFDFPTRRFSPGRVRKGLDAETRAARAGGHELSEAGLAALRTLADQIDRLSRLVAWSEKPYDVVPLTGMLHEYGEGLDRVFAAAHTEADPFAAWLA